MQLRPAILTPDAQTVSTRLELAATDVQRLADSAADVDGSGMIDVDELGAARAVADANVDGRISANELNDLYDATRPLPDDVSHVSRDVLQRFVTSRVQSNGERAVRRASEPYGVAYNERCDAEDGIKIAEQLSSEELRALNQIFEPARRSAKSLQELHAERASLGDPTSVAARVTSAETRVAAATREVSDARAALGELGKTKPGIARMNAPQITKAKDEIAGLTRSRDEVQAQLEATRGTRATELQTRVEGLTKRMGIIEEKIAPHVRIEKAEAALNDARRSLALAQRDQTRGPQLEGEVDYARMRDRAKLKTEDAGARLSRAKASESIARHRYDAHVAILDNVRSTTHAAVWEAGTRDLVALDRSKERLDAVTLAAAEPLRMVSAVRVAIEHGKVSRHAFKPGAIEKDAALWSGFRNEAISAHAVAARSAVDAWNSPAFAEELMKRPKAEQLDLVRRFASGLGESREGVKYFRENVEAALEGSVNAPNPWRNLFATSFTSAQEKADLIDSWKGAFLKLPRAAAEQLLNTAGTRALTENALHSGERGERATTRFWANGGGPLDDERDAKLKQTTSAIASKLTSVARAIEVKGAFGTEAWAHGLFSSGNKAAAVIATVEREVAKESVSYFWQNYVTSPVLRGGFAAFDMIDAASEAAEASHALDEATKRADYMGVVGSFAVVAGKSAVAAGAGMMASIELAAPGAIVWTAGKLTSFAGKAWNYLFADNEVERLVKEHAPHWMR